MPGWRDQALCNLRDIGYDPWGFDWWGWWDSFDWFEYFKSEVFGCTVAIVPVQDVVWAQGTRMEGHNIPCPYPRREKWLRDAALVGWQGPHHLHLSCEGVWFFQRFLTAYRYDHVSGNGYGGISRRYVPHNMYDLLWDLANQIEQQAYDW